MLAFQRLKRKTAEKYNLDRFELSQNYNFFDKLEKANLFLEKIIETRKKISMTGRLFFS